MRLIPASSRPLFVAAFVFVLVAAGMNGNRSTAGPDPGEPEAQEVAREVLKLQQAMGGSVVELPEEVTGANTSVSALEQKVQANPIGTKDPVLALRQAGLQLDLLAHRLELNDLYAQADATRELAQRLRRDARRLKQAEPAEKPH